MIGWVLRVSALVLLVPLGGYAVLGWFSRYASDDYCTAGITLTLGWLPAQEYWYRLWSGRYTFTAIVSALDIPGHAVAQVLPLLSLLVWLGVTTWAGLPIACRLAWRFPRMAPFLIAEVIVFSTLTAAPNIGQSFYMQAGVVTYTFPLILITLYAGWVARVVLAADGRRRLPRDMAVSGFATLLIGGLNETTATVYTACLGLAGLVGLVGLRGDRRRVLVGLMVAGVVGLLLATVLMGIAPGTRLRVAQEDDPGFSLSRVPLTLRASLELAVAIARRFEALSRPEFAFTFLVPLALGWATPSSRTVAPPAAGRSSVGTELRHAGLAMLILGSGLALMTLSLFPSYLVQGYDPPARIQQITDFLLVLALVATGFVAGRRLASWTGRWQRLSLVGLSLGLLLLAVVPLRDALSLFGQVPVESAYAADWDRVDQFLRSARPPADGVVTASPLPPRWGWAFIDQTPGDFPNACVARYYGLPAVAASGPAPVWTGATEPGGRPPGANVGR